MNNKITGLTSKGRQTRSRIVEAAARLVAVRGATRTTLDDIRAEAGVSSSQIYHYFTDKQSLLTAVVDLRHSDVSDGVSPMLGSFESVAEVRAWGESLIDHQRQSQYRGCPIATLGSDLAVTDRAVRMRIAQALHRSEDCMREGYRAMRANGEIAVDADPDALASLTLSTVIGGTLLTQLDRDTAALKAAIAALLDSLERGGTARNGQSTK